MNRKGSVFSSLPPVFWAAGAMALVAFVVFLSVRGDNPVSDEQNEVVTEMTELVETTSAPATSQTTIAPPQPDASDDSPAVTTNAIRAEEDRDTPVPLGFAIVEELAHDTSSFTQGLEIFDDRLFESNGAGVQESSIRELDLETGEAIRTTEVPDVFAEGLTIVGDTAIQITWRNQVAYRRDVDTFEVIETYDYEGEGWGICHDGSQLVMSDGTSTIDFRDPDTFELVSSVDVTFSGEPIELINELECVGGPGGSVWANIWQSLLIIEIDPATGNVIGVLDAAPLTPVGLTNNQAVLNGIAYDPSDGTFLLTGKLWPTIYRVQIQPADQ